MTNPFEVLGVAENADDAAIKSAYLQQVRKHPPERDPAYFQVIRSAFEAIKTRRDRLSYRLFTHDQPDVEGLLVKALHTSGGNRPTEKQLLQVLNGVLAARAR